MLRNIFINVREQIFILKTPAYLIWGHNTVAIIICSNPLRHKRVVYFHPFGFSFYSLLQSNVNLPYKLSRKTSFRLNFSIGWQNALLALKW